MRTSSPVPPSPPRFPAWPGLMLGALLAAGLWFAGPTLKRLVPESWDYLLREPALVGQGVFLFLLITLLGEWSLLRRLAEQTVRMEQPDDSSWPARVWQSALISLDLRPDRRQRHETLTRCRRRLERALNRRWQCYFLLALVPAASTLVVGLRALRLDGTPLQPFLSYFQPLILGTAEGVVLIFLALLTREKGSRILAAWLKKASAYEENLGKPVAPVMEPTAPPAEQPPARAGAATKSRGDARGLRLRGCNRLLPACPLRSDQPCSSPKLKFCSLVGLLILAGFNMLAVHTYRQAVPAEQAGSGTPNPGRPSEGTTVSLDHSLPGWDSEWTIRIKMDNGFRAPTPDPIHPLTPNPTINPVVVSRPLSGDVLVLVLETNASRFTDEKFVRQLEKIKEAHGPRLFNQTIYRISPQKIEPWRPEPSAKMFENAHYDAMFTQVFKEVEKLADQASNRSFRTILLWESDEDPRFGDKAITPPRGRTYYLCYWFTNRMDDSSSLADWFGPSHAKRPPRMEDLAAFVDYFIKRR